MNHQYRFEFRIAATGTILLEGESYEEAKAEFNRTKIVELLDYTDVCDATIAVVTQL